MQFLYPTFLVALAALAIPIIIHLFFFRRFKKVYFTNVRFLKEVKEETSARRKLRNLLVLLMRCLALAFLVFAFAQPFIPKDVAVKKGDKAVSIFIDNSFSMSALSEDVPLIDKAKQRARDIINAYSVEDRFQILTNDFEGRHQRLQSKEDALSLVDEIEISPSVRALSKVLSMQGQALQTGSAVNEVAYLISDFQKNITDLDAFSDTTMEVNLVPLQSVQEKNISLDSAWFDAPVQMVNQTNTLIVRVKNLSNEAVDNIRLTINYEGQVKPVGSLAIPPNSVVLDTVNLSILHTGWHEGELTVTDYPVQFDDKYYFSFHVLEEINVLIINELDPNNFLNAAFSGIDYFKVTNQLSRNLDYSKFPTFQLIVTNGLVSLSSGLAFELKQYVENGGNLLVFPAANANIGSYKNFLESIPANELLNFEEQERIVSDINTDEFVFKDVFENTGANLKLPVSKGNFNLTNFGSRGEERLLTYRNGNTFIGKYSAGQGHFYLCAAPLDEEMNNLVKSGEIFIPMLYKMAISSGKARRIAFTIGKDEVIEVDNFVQGGEKVYKLRGKKKEFIPEQRIVGAKVFLGIHNQIKEAGYYELFLTEKESPANFAFNYDRKESALEYFSEKDLNENWGAKMSIIGANAKAAFENLIQERSRGIILWRWCLIMALFFLAVESTLLRFWKV